jgi:3'-phosphoadenosine 5'-phosphosulfate sulfotransferase (PAPS reductase)/FAD synthetase
MEHWQLKQLQSLPLEAKIRRTNRKIIEWYDHWEGDVCVSFSGGKDSTVLLDLVRNIYPNVPAVFSDTGLEYPEIRDFVKTFPNVFVVRPKMHFKQVLEQYGYPIVSKQNSRAISDIQRASSKNKNVVKLRLTGINSSGKECKSFKLPNKWHFLKDAPFKISDKCCEVMKKQPILAMYKTMGVHPYVGTMAGESLRRSRDYRTNGCNAYNLGHPISAPLSFWTEQDVLEYIYKNNLPYADVYGEIIFEDGRYKTTGEQRTGCMFCGFGVHLEKGENRFQRMARTHPKQHKYCMENLGMRQVLEYIGVATGCENTEEFTLVP